MNGSWLPAARVAVSDRAHRWVRGTRGRLDVNLARARFVTNNHEKDWRPLAAPTAVTLLPRHHAGATVLRVACGEDVAQFVVACPRVDVLLFLATAVPAPLLQSI